MYIFVLSIVLGDEECSGKEDRIFIFMGKEG